MISAIPAEKRGNCFPFICCAKATLLLAPKEKNRDSSPVETAIAKGSAETADVIWFRGHPSNADTVHIACAANYIRCSTKGVVTNGRSSYEPK